MRAVAQQRLELLDMMRCRDDQEFAQPAEHQRRQRIVDHRLVVDGKQVLVDAARQRLEPRARPAGHDDRRPSSQFAP